MRGGVLNGAVPAVIYLSAESTLSNQLSVAPSNSENRIINSLCRKIINHQPKSNWNCRGGFLPAVSSARRAPLLGEAGQRRLPKPFSTISSALPMKKNYSAQELPPPKVIAKDWVSPCWLLSRETREVERLRAFLTPKTQPSS